MNRNLISNLVQTATVGYFSDMDNLTSYQLNEAIAAAISNVVNSEAFKAYIRSLTV